MHIHLDSGTLLCAQDKNAEVVMKAMIACSQRDDQLQLFLTTMLSGGDIADNLMKYIYRGLKQPDNSALLLKMHEKVLAAAGQGAYTSLQHVMRLIAAMRRN